MPSEDRENPRTENHEDVPYTDDLCLRGMLGQGGIGRVYLGYDKRIGREVAIKEPIAEKIAANRERALARFVREARISGQLEHPGIIPVYELSKKEDGTYFYVMKRVEGRRLKEAIATCKDTTPEKELSMRLALLPSFTSVCDAVGFAHSKGFIHRDLKPENIILGEFGEAVLLDWGLAKRIGEEEPEEPAEDHSAESIEDLADSMKTRHGAVLGTPSYMAPEQIDKRCGAVGPASDVYALGAMLFLILTGEKMYHGTPKEIMRELASNEPSPSPLERMKNLPVELVAICEKAVSKNQAERFRDASEFARELKAYRVGRLVSVYAYSTRELFARFVARNKIAIVAAIAVIVSIIAGAGLALNFAADARAARVRAERAFVDVTDLSRSAIQLSTDTATSAGSYYTGVVKALDDSAQ
ncbi:MAG: serine/threonine-protein kinase, partial [bacterium]